MMELSGLADEDTGGEDQTAADDYLKAGESETGLEVAVANESDDNELDSDDSVYPGEGGVNIGDQEGQCVKEDADEGHEAGDDSAKDWIAATGEFPVVGESFGEGHRDAGADGGAAPIRKTVRELCVAKAVAKIGASRDGAVHKAGEAGLNYAQDKGLVVADHSVQCGQVGKIF
jgi:hypothetical protein